MLLIILLNHEKIATSSNFLVTPEQYRNLTKSLLAGFQQKNGHPILLKGIHHQSNDAFYEAKGRYHYSILVTLGWMTNWLKAALKACIGLLSLRPCWNNIDSLHASQFLVYVRLQAVWTFSDGLYFDKSQKPFII